MFGIPGSHLWAAAILAPAGFVAGFGAAWAAGTAIIATHRRKGYGHVRRRR